MISDEDIDRVRAATDLVELVQETVPLKPRNREFWGCCPFHQEKTPSFHVIPANQSWHCFGCDSGGDVFGYVMKRENLSFPEAVRYLADRAGIEIVDDRSGSGPQSKRSRLVEVCEETSRFYHMLLMRGKDPRPREYFASRGMGGDVCRRYRLGFAPGRGALVAHLGARGFTTTEMVEANVAFRREGGAVVDRFFDRVMFPILDELGRCIAFGGRLMGPGEPKYLNTSETPLFHKKRNLYAFNWAKDEIVARQEAVVVEGYTDAIACHESGIRNVVATLGTALTAQHVKTLTRFAKRVIYLFDGDEAGQRAAERAIQFIENDSIDLRCVVLPDGSDPMEFITAHGGDALRDLLDRSEPLMDFVFRKLEERADLTTPGGRTKALEDACRLIYPLRSSYMIDTYYVQIADRVGLDVENVRQVAPRVFRQVQQEEETRDRRSRDREAARASRSARGASAMPAGASPSDEVPLDAYGFAPDSGAQVQVPAEGSPDADGTVVYTELERRALACERELLTLLTSDPDVFRSFADRIVDISWVDSRHESIAWAVLATPEGSSGADAMAAARAVCPEAAELVGSGTLGATSAHPTEVNISFLLDTLELLTVRRRIRAAQAKLRSGSALSDAERRELAVSAARDAVRQRELVRAVEDVADPFAERISGLAEGQGDDASSTSDASALSASQTDAPSGA